MLRRFKRVVMVSFIVLAAPGCLVACLLAHQPRTQPSLYLVCGLAPMIVREPWQCFHLRPLPQVQGSLRPRRASCVA